MRKPRRITDYISGKQVAAIPEEVEATQVFSKRLVSDFGYAKEQIQTRPQYRVRRRPSAKSGSYPVDIAVFTASAKQDDELLMIVECKAPDEKEDLRPLRDYLDLSSAQIGVWFNGNSHAYIRKILNRDGSRNFETIHSIPRNGQRIEDIGLFKRADLKPPSNLKSVFRDLRNHLAGNVTGITRDEALAQEILNILFCKIYDEVNTGLDEMVTFRCGHEEPPEEVFGRLAGLFAKVKEEYSDVFSQGDSITLKPKDLAYVVGELHSYCVIEADRDAVGDAFEVFIGPALRGAEGQFFTPRNVIRMMVDMMDPEPTDLIVDPACGSGGFLIVALQYAWQKLEGKAKSHGWDPRLLARQKNQVASRCFRGLEKDSFLAKVTKAYMAIMGDGRGGVFCANSLNVPDAWEPSVQEKVQLASFDKIFTNPPFGKKLKVKDKAILAQYALGHNWKKSSGELTQSNSLPSHRPPQLLFLERCVQLLKPGGKLGIVMPESILGNPSYRYIMAWLRSNVLIRAIVTMPEELFKTSGKGGTHCKVAVLILEKKRPDVPEEDCDIFMADAKWCGHDSRGNPTNRERADGTTELLDDTSTIAERFTALSSEGHLGFYYSTEHVVRDIFVPKYYNPELANAWKSLNPATS